MTSPPNSATPAPDAIPPYCRTCRRALQWRLSPSGIVDFIHARLMRNLALNGVANVVAERSAAGDRTGRRGFRVETREGIPSNSGFAAAGDTASLEVDTVRLDDYVHEHGIAVVDLLKLDVEAGEPEVLAGLSRTLARDRPDILCEVLPWADAERLEATLGPLGYRYRQLLPEGPVPRARIVGDPVWFNYLFTAREGS